MTEILLWFIVGACISLMLLMGRLIKLLKLLLQELAEHFDD